jgi:capsular exopolysaccharide synthesis family protein
MLIFCVGIVPAALTCGAVWQLLPAKYTAFSLIRVRASEHQVLPVDRHSQDLALFRDTQPQVVKSRHVLRKALEAEKVRNLPTTRENPDPETWLQEELRVQYVQGTELLKVSLQGRSAADLPAVVNAVSGAYLEEVERSERERWVDRLQAMRRACEQREAEVARLRDALAAKLRALRADRTGLSLEQRQSAERYTDLQASSKRLQEKLQDAKARLEPAAQPARVYVPGVYSMLVIPRRSIKAAALTAAQLDEYAVRDPEWASSGQALLKVVEAARQRRDSAKNGRLNLETPEGKQRLREFENEVRQAEAALETFRAGLRLRVQDRLVTALEAEAEKSKSAAAAEIVRLEKQMQQVNADLAQAEAQLGSAMVPSSEVEDLRHSIGGEEGFLDKLRMERARLEIEAMPNVRRVELFQEAEVPTIRNLLSQGIISVMSGVAVFALVGLAVGLRELFRLRLTDSGDLTSELGFPVLGTLPAYPKGERTAGGAVALTGRAWQSVLIEAIDTIRTILVRDAERAGTRVFMITSAESQEGKTTLATHLALSLARIGHRTLLVECDLRRPALSALFGVTALPGVGEVLRGEKSAEECLRAVPPASLWLLTAGLPSRDAVEGLAKKEFRTLMAGLRQNFDYVIVDSPPVLPVADGLLIAQSVDRVIMSVRPNISHLPRVETAVARLHALGIPLYGMVVNGTATRRDHYGHDYNLPSAG